MIRWKPIPGFSLFEASSGGCVRRVAYAFFTKGPRQALPAVLKGWVSQSGYWTVNIPKDDGPYSRQLVHRLVCLAFNARPEGKDLVCHIDGNKRNNVPGNLYWGDRFDNADDAKRLGEQVCWRDRPEGHPTAKLTETNVRAIKGRLRDGETIVAIAQSHGVSRSTVAMISAGKNWAYVQ